jgi:hypothetical protein
MFGCFHHEHFQKNHFSKEYFLKTKPIRFKQWPLRMLSLTKKTEKGPFIFHLKLMAMQRRNCRKDVEVIRRTLSFANRLLFVFQCQRRQLKRLQEEMPASLANLFNRLF